MGYSCGTGNGTAKSMSKAGSGGVLLKLEAVDVSSWVLENFQGLETKKQWFLPSFYPPVSYQYLSKTEPNGNLSSRGVLER